MSHTYGAIAILMALFSVTPTFSQNLLNEPEGIVYDSVYNRYLVSNWITGTVVQIDSTGQQSYFRTGLGYCAEIIIGGGVAYVAVNNAGVVGLDLATGVTVMSVTLAGAGGCHDMAIDTSGYMYTTDFIRHRIYRIDLSDNSYSIFASGSDGLNAPLGIYFDASGNRLIITSMANNYPIKALDIAGVTVTSLTNPHFVNHDGITRDHMGNYYISTVGNNSPTSNNSIYRFNSTFSTEPQLIASGLHGHTDMCFNSRNNILAAAVTWDQQVFYLRIYGCAQLDQCTFSDQLHGDGDGVLEGGESIELVYQMSNVGVDTITDLSVNLFTNDGALRIIDGSSYSGDVSSWQTVDNEGDPFLFEIPPDFIPRLDSFYLEVSWGCDTGTVVDTIAIGANIGGTAILLVNDDGGSGVDGYYTSCLDDAHVPYHVWSSPPAPSASDLTGYDIVVWFVGDYRASPLDEDEINAIKGFLDAGGKLFLTGQGIAAQLDMTDPSFLSDYLHSNYVTTGLVPLLIGAGGQALDLSDSISISGAGGAANQTSPDHLAGVNGGTAELYYAGSTDAGAVSYEGAYSVIVSGFGFEAIVSGSSRWTDRATIMHEILDFFGYQWPQASLSLAVAPGDPMHLAEHTPEFSWNYADRGFAQTAYRLQVDSDNDWSVVDMWDSDSVSSSGASAVYGGAPLNDGSTYYYRVKTFDGTRWSYWYHGDFRMNSAPASPTNLTPDDMQELTDNPPALSHANSQDNEGDVLTYSYEIYSDELLTELLAQGSGIPEGDGGTTTWQPSAALPGENDCFWRVRAYDGFENGDWSLAASFYIRSPHVCGDANGDGAANVGDAVYLINFVFKGGAAPDPLCVGDANDDDNTNVGDAVYMINYVFKGGPPPKETCCP